MQDNKEIKEIIDKAVSALNRPVRMLRELTTRDQINHLINHSYDSDKSCKDFIVSYREIEPLFKGNPHPRFLRLTIINTTELEDWANINNLKVDYLIGTEDLSLRPIHFQIL
jgi:hypothetical protein